MGLSSSIQAVNLVTSIGGFLSKHTQDFPHNFVLIDEEETKSCYKENAHQVLISLSLITSQTKSGLHKQLHQKKISMDEVEKLLKRQTKTLKLSR